jgi:hypothetical protein
MSQDPNGGAISRTRVRGINILARWQAPDIQPNNPPPFFVLSRTWPQQSSVYRETIDNRDSDRHLEIFFKQTMWLLAPDAEDSPGLSPNGSGVKG